VVHNNFTGMKVKVIEITNNIAHNGTTTDGNLIPWDPFGSE